MAMKVGELLRIPLGLFLIGCGVRGDPVPPAQPTELGRGKPTYDRAMDEVLKKRKNSDEQENKKRQESSIQ